MKQASTVASQEKPQIEESEPADTMPEKEFTGTGCLSTALLLDAGSAAQLCGLAKSTWQRLSNAGRVPAPIKLGRRSLWSRFELEAWVAMGCPVRQKWNSIKKKGYDLLYRQKHGCMCTYRKEA